MSRSRRHRAQRQPAGVLHEELPHVRIALQERRAMIVLDHAAAQRQLPQGPRHEPSKGRDQHLHRRQRPPREPPLQNAACEPARLLVQRRQRDRGAEGKADRTAFGDVQMVEQREQIGRQIFMAIAHQASAVWSAFWQLVSDAAELRLQSVHQHHERNRVAGHARYHHKRRPATPNHITATIAARVNFALLRLRPPMLQTFAQDQALAQSGSSCGDVECGQDGASERVMVSIHVREIASGKLNAFPGSAWQRNTRRLCLPYDGPICPEAQRGRPS